MTARCALYASASHDTVVSRTRVKLNRVFCVRFLVSPKFPHVPLGVGGRPLGYEEHRWYAKCPCNLFPRFQTYVITIHQCYRQTDGQMMCDLNTYHALHQSALHGKKVVIFGLKSGDLRLRLNAVR